MQLQDGNILSAVLISATVIFSLSGIDVETWDYQLIRLVQKLSIKLETPATRYVLSFVIFVRFLLKT
jgi:hypothetical protein